VGATEELRSAYRALGVRVTRAQQDGDFDKALRLARLRVEAAGPFAEPAMRGTPYQQIGQALGAEQKHAEALDAFQTGLHLAEEGHDTRLQAAFWSIIATPLRILGRVDESRQAAESALRLSEEDKDNRGMAFALSALGETLRVMGQWQLAAEEFGRAIVAADRADLPALVESTRLSLADLYIAQHDYEVALSYIEKTPRPAGPTPADIRHAASYDSRLGFVLQRMNRPAARPTLERALGEAREAGDAAQEAWVLQRLAELDELARPEDAAARYREAALVHARAGDVVQESSSWAFLARLYTTIGKPAEAETAARQAIDAASRAKYPVFLGGAWDELGRALRDEGRIDEAKRAFEQSVDWTERQRAEIIGGDANGANFFDSRSAPYRSLMDLCARSDETLRAVQLAEQVRARRLLDVLAQGHVDPQADMTPDERRKEQALVREADARNADLMRASPPPDAKDRFEKAARDLETFRAELFAAHTTLRSRRGWSDPLSEADLLALVPDTTTLLVEYAFSERGAWIFTTARSAEGTLALHATRLAVKTGDLEARVQQFHEALAMHDLAFASQARGLYRDLLAPIESALQGRARIAIVPDGALWNLPFHALMAPTGRYLIERAAVSYAPSLTTLRDSTRRSSASAASLKPALVFASSASSLTGTADEARQIQRLYGPGAVAVTGAAATETRWKQEAPHYRVLHVASHGVLNDSNPLFSFVTLGKGGSDDGLLEAREMLTLDLHAAIVVLSACETGRGQLVNGEGLVGLSWAVLTAGAPTAVVSQWKVDAASTTRLMVAFHRALASTPGGPVLRGKAHALRSAALDLIHTPAFRHPFYWAGFSMLGDGR
jgi:CHAT domain-containing protein